jgi:hypothetical protein
MATGAALLTGGLSGVVNVFLYPTHTVAAAPSHNATGTATSDVRRLPPPQTEQQARTDDDLQQRRRAEQDAYKRLHREK